MGDDTGRTSCFADGYSGFAAVDRLHHLFARHATLKWRVCHVAGARPCWGLATGALDFGALSLDNTGLNVWLGLLAFSPVLGVGISWCHVRRALSGQADMDDVYS